MIVQVRFISTSPWTNIPELASRTGESSANGKLRQEVEACRLTPSPSLERRTYGRILRRRGEQCQALDEQRRNEQRSTNHHRSIPRRLQLSSIVELPSRSCSFGLNPID